MSAVDLKVAELLILRSFMLNKRQEMSGCNWWQNKDIKYMRANAIKTYIILTYLVLFTLYITLFSLNKISLICALLNEPGT
jgi:hypothetical protein